MVMTRDRVTDIEGSSAKPTDDSEIRRDPLMQTSQIELDHNAQEIILASRGKKTACLVVLQGIDAGSIIPLEKSKVLIGRSSDCDAVMREDGISRTHAVLERLQGNRVLIRDLGSTNGTFVEGRRITEAMLKSGDKLLLGKNTVLKFIFQDQVDFLYHQKMYDSAIRDGLTGAYNRKYLNERIVTDFSYAKRHKTSLSFVIFDLDDFKNINDIYGHQTGDHVLISIAASVSQIIRAEDVFARYGGEEFAIIAPCLDFKGSKVLCERILDRIAKMSIYALDDSKQVLNVTASVGSTTMFPNSTTDSFAIVAEADHNLYKAKENGKNQIVASQIAQ